MILLSHTKRKTKMLIQYFRFVLLRLDYYYILLWKIIIFFLGRKYTVE